MSKLTAIRNSMFTQTERPYSTTEFTMPAMPSLQKIKPLTDMFSMQTFRGGGYQWINTSAEYNNSDGGSFVYYLNEDTAEMRISAHIPIYILGFESMSSYCIYNENEIKLYWIGGRSDEKTVFRFIRVTSSNMNVQHGEVDIETPIEEATPELLPDRQRIIQAVAVDGTLDGFELIASISGYTTPTEQETFYYRVRVSYSGNITSISRVSMPGEGFIETLDNEHLIRVMRSKETSPGVYSPVQVWIIDAGTLAVKATKVFHDISGYSAGARIGYGLPVGATRPRNTLYEKALYGRRIVAAVEARDLASTTVNGRTVVWLEDPGSNTITEVELSGPGVEHIIGTNRAGDVCYYLRPDSDINTASINLQRSDGSLAWSNTYQEWQDAGWANEWWAFTQFINRRGGARTTEDDEISFRYDEASSEAPYMNVVLDHSTGFPKSSSKPNYLLPTMGGNLLCNVTVFDQYDAVTDTVKQSELLINTYSKIEGSPADRSADKFRYIQYTTKYTANFIIKMSNTEEPVGWGGPEVSAMVEGNFAFAQWDNTTKLWFLDVPNVGANIEIIASMRGYKTAKITYMFEPGIIPVILLEPLSWNRKSYEIYTPQDLYDVREDPVGNYTIMNDIDMQGFVWDPMFTSSNNPFMGNVDGQGFTIRNFRYLENENSSDVSNYASIFGKTINATFKNINIDSSEVTAQSGNGVAVLVASAEYTEIYYENQPPNYEKQFPSFENIKAKNCKVSSIYGASYHAIICGEFAINYPYSTTEEPFVECSAINCEIQGLEYGGSYYAFGGILGYANINAPAQ